MGFCKMFFFMLIVLRSRLVFIGSWFIFLGNLCGFLSFMNYDGIIWKMYEVKCIERVVCRVRGLMGRMVLMVGREIRGMNLSGGSFVIEKGRRVFVYLDEKFYIRISIFTFNFIVMVL